MSGSSSDLEALLALALSPIEAQGEITEVEEFLSTFKIEPGYYVVRPCYIYYMYFTWKILKGERDSLIRPYQFNQQLRKDFKLTNDGKWFGVKNKDVVCLNGRHQKLAAKVSNLLRKRTSTQKRNSNLRLLIEEIESNTLGYLPAISAKLNSSSTT